LGDQDVVARFKELVPQAVIVDEQDGRPAERELLLAQSKVFIFMGHGKSGALLLANGKPLKAEDFPQQSLANMQLAVLMACSSGVAKEGLLDTGGLIHAFQAGGTPAVIASQWNVAIDFTEQFMDRFFSNMKKGDSPAQALFEARKQLFRVKSHPYYWAAFTISGRA
jgi:CHAT domain-containing protein